jgi:hypothetical protein
MFLWEMLVFKCPFWTRWYEIVAMSFVDMAACLSIHNTLELHLSALGGTASHPDNWIFL